MKLTPLPILFLLVISGAALGVTIHESGYNTEPYAWCSPLVTHTYSMAFDNTGTLHVDQPFDDRVYQILPNGAVDRVISIPNTTSGLEWTGGTRYGDYLYVTANTNLLRIAPDGTVSPFASGFPGASEAAVNRTGNYGGYLYISTGGSDRIYRVGAAGDVSIFSSWPGSTSGGGPMGIEFDEIGHYGGLMYVATSFGSKAPSKSGLFALDAAGSESRFAAGIVVAREIAFDKHGLFNLDMFVLGAPDFAEPLGVWRVTPDGTATLFATTTQSRIGSLVFGPDAAMYISEYSTDAQEITITRVIPEPATILLLGSASLCVLRRHRPPEQ